MADSIDLQRQVDAIAARIKRPHEIPASAMREAIWARLVSGEPMRDGWVIADARRMVLAKTGPGSRPAHIRAMAWAAVNVPEFPPIIAGMAAYLMRVGGLDVSPETVRARLKAQGKDHLTNEAIGITAEEHREVGRRYGADL